MGRCLLKKIFGVAAPEGLMAAPTSQCVFFSLVSQAINVQIIPHLGTFEHLGKCHCYVICSDCNMSVEAEHKCVNSTSGFQLSNV